MSGQGFDTWILEVRGSGLSIHGSHPKEIEKYVHEVSVKMQAAVDNATDGVFTDAQQSTNVNSTTAESEVYVTSEYLTGIATVWDKSKLVTTLTETFICLSERLSGFFSEGHSKIIYLKLFDQISRFFEMEYIKAQTQPKDGKVLTIGHSMGGILLYAMLSRFCSEGREFGGIIIGTMIGSNMVLDEVSRAGPRNVVITGRYLMQRMMNLGVLMAVSWQRLHKPLKSSLNVRWL